MSDVIVSTIRENPLFEHLSEGHVNSLVENATLLECEAGDSIIEEGGTAEKLYIVADGAVRVWTASMGRDVELKTLGAGSYFGEVSLMSGKSATASVDARGDDVRLVAIDKDAFLDVLEDDDELRTKLEGVTLARAKDTIGKVLK